MKGYHRMKKDLLGAHLSIAGGVHTVFERAAQTGCRTVQIFTKSNKAYFAKALAPEECERFKTLWQQSDVADIVTHAAYLINIGASNPEVEKKSRASLRAELERCHQLGIKYLVLHPGSHTGAGMATGIEKIAANLSNILADEQGDTMILLETAAGQGTNVGSAFAELRAIYDACDKKVQKRIGICLDTCHVFAAGYDISTLEGYKALWEHFDETIGRDLLKVIHLNGSKMACNSRRDRHANLGEGYIPTEMLKKFADDFGGAEGIPVILETPSADGITEYLNELQLLRS